MCEFPDGKPNVSGVLEARSADRSATMQRGTRRPSKKNVAGKFVGRRKIKPRLLAVINGACTGCSGSPVCQHCCPVEGCMVLVPDEWAYPFHCVVVDPLKCVGCKKCLSRGPEHTFLDGCPWDAILMVPTRDWEAEHGELPY
jgi:ferredoxin